MPGRSKKIGITCTFFSTPYEHFWEQSLAHLIFSIISPEKSHFKRAHENVS